MGIKQSPEAARMWSLAARYSAVALEMGIATGIGVWIGNWLDTRWHSQPWCLLLGFAVGLGAAVKAVVRVLRQGLQISKNHTPDDPTPP